MSKNITIKEGAVARNFTGVKKLQTNVIGGGNQLWIPEDEAADYCTFKKITLRQNGTVKAEDNACDGFSEVTVDIPADLKEKVITDNGEYLAADDNCAGYSKVTVNVAGGGGGGPFTVIFYAADRTTILERQTVESGGGAVYHGETPTSSGMRFIGWSPNPVNVRSDMNCYPRFENLIYDTTQITDDWVTIAQNIRRNPDYYPIGAWKLLELGTLAYADMDEYTRSILWAWGGGGGENTFVNPSFVAMRLMAKGVDQLEGNNGYAPTTWVPYSSWYSATGASNISIQFNIEHARQWHKCNIREFFMRQFTSILFPQDLLPYIRRVVKHTRVYDNDEYNIMIPNKQTIDWFFLLSDREVFGRASDFPSDYETQGAIYFDDTTSKDQASTIRAISNLDGLITTDDVLLRTQHDQSVMRTRAVNGSEYYQTMGGRNCAFGFCL